MLAVMDERTMAIIRKLPATRTYPARQVALHCCDAAAGPQGMQRL